MTWTPILLMLRKGGGRRQSLENDESLSGCDLDVALLVIPPAADLTEENLPLSRVRKPPVLLLAHRRIFYTKLA